MLYIQEALFTKNKMVMTTTVIDGNCQTTEINMLLFTLDN